MTAHTATASDRFIAALERLGCARWRRDGQIVKEQLAEQWRIRPRRFVTPALEKLSPQRAEQVGQALDLCAYGIGAGHPSANALRDAFAEFVRNISDPKDAQDIRDYFDITERTYHHFSIWTSLEW